MQFRINTYVLNIAFDNHKLADMFVTGIMQMNYYFYRITCTFSINIEHSNLKRRKKGSLHSQLNTAGLALIAQLLSHFRKRLLSVDRVLPTFRLGIKPFLRSKKRSNTAPCNENRMVPSISPCQLQAIMRSSFQVGNPIFSSGIFFSRCQRSVIVLYELHGIFVLLLNSRFNIGNIRVPYLISTQNPNTILFKKKIKQNCNLQEKVKIIYDAIYSFNFFLINLKIIIINIKQSYLALAKQSQAL